MLPLNLLYASKGQPIFVELKNGESYNGHLSTCDNWMNLELKEDGERFWKMPECYLRGNTIKYLRIPDEVIDKVKEDQKKFAASNGRGRGRGK